MPDNWKTIRVPEHVYEAAKTHKETHDDTWGDVVAYYADGKLSEGDHPFGNDNPDIASVLDASEADIESAKDEILGRIDDLEARLPRKISEELR